jgi:hypothetical protein
VAAFSPDLDSKAHWFLNQILPEEKASLQSSLFTATMAWLGDGGSILQRPIPSREPFLVVKDIVPGSLLQRGFLKPQLPPAALGA